MSSTLDYAIMLTDHQAVERFIERLAAFSLDQWLSVAASLTRDPRSREGANAMLGQLVAQHKLGVAAWNIADDVETALQYSIGSMGCAPSRRQRVTSTRAPGGKYGGARATCPPTPDHPGLRVAAPPLRVGGSAIQSDRPASYA
jgi:hypothetical protein